jgi:hypothetical protein
MFVKMSSTLLKLIIDVSSLSTAITNISFRGLSPIVSLKYDFIRLRDEKMRSLDDAETSKAIRMVITFNVSE